MNNTLNREEDFATIVNISAVEYGAGTVMDINAVKEQNTVCT